MINNGAVCICNMENLHKGLKLFDHVFNYNDYCIIKLYQFKD